MNRIVAQLNVVENESQLSGCTVNNLAFDITINLLFACNWNGWANASLTNEMWLRKIPIALTGSRYIGWSFELTTMQIGRYINHHKVIKYSCWIWTYLLIDVSYCNTYQNEIGRLLYSLRPMGCLKFAPKRQYSSVSYI